MEEKDARGGAVRVGMVWGGIGGVLGFLVSLLGALAGVILAGFVGFSCGRRAALADGGRRSGALSGLIAGAIATPVYVVGAAAGAVVSASRLGSAEIAAMLSEMLAVEVSPQEAWELLIASVALAAFLQAAVFILAATAAGAWAARKR
ncbi:MAG: hypothetical protein AB1425_04320 [Actinomycetota bacterium]